MYERFTERARQVVVLAQDEARAYGHEEITTGHLVLGLLREESGIAARILEEHDIDLTEVRHVVCRELGDHGRGATGQIPFSADAVKAQELALREALSLGHNYIGTEHILLGLLRIQAQHTDELLAGIFYEGEEEVIRDSVIKYLSGPKRKPEQEEEDSKRLRIWATCQHPDCTLCVYENYPALRADVLKLLKMLDD